MTGYALRLSEAEIARYLRMAASARADETDLWNRAGIVGGARVADLGCGPGATLVAMAEAVGPSGAVTGVDADPEAIGVARELIAAAKLDHAQARVGNAAETGLARESVDVAVLRHVLAHNGRTEQALVDHAASLVRPGGCVYLLDIESSLFRSVPADANLAELWAAYEAFHAHRGNDLKVGLRLHALLAGAGLDVEFHTIRGVVQDRPAGQRPPPWAAREAMVAAGVADAADLARWEAGLLALDAAPTPIRQYIPFFIAVGRKPE